jgi:hypothetical protein
MQNHSCHLGAIDGMPPCHRHKLSYRSRKHGFHIPTLLDLLVAKCQSPINPNATPMLGKKYWDPKESGNTVSKRPIGERHDQSLQQ